MKANISFFSALFAPSTKQILLKSLGHYLINLSTGLKKIEGMNNHVEAVVELFKVISPIQDAGAFKEVIDKLKRINREQDAHIIETLEALQVHLDQAGRNLYGWNRTRVGEKVSTSTVFLGDVFGIHTLSADHFLDNRERLQQELRPDISTDPENPVSNWWVINVYQCKKFVESHATPMLAHIDTIRRFVS